MKVSTSVAAFVLASVSSAAGFGHRVHMKPPPLSLDDINNKNNNNMQNRHDHSGFTASSNARPIRGTNRIGDKNRRWSSSSTLKNTPAPAVNMSKISLATFQQQVDHDDPSQGTFSQRYWYNTEYWTGPGAPVVLFTPGESAAEEYTGYLTNKTITGLFAQAIGGAVVMFEHRYWGQSSPFTNLTTKNLRYLTLANSIADTTNFARNVQLPFDKNATGSSNAPNAPWVMSGGSYSGALTAWVEHIDPGTFWAYHASSAVVESIGNFWQYFEPVRQGMPQNCSADVQLVVEHVDKVLTTGTDVEIKALKVQFGLGSVEHNDDFAS